MSCKNTLSLKNSIPPVTQYDALLDLCVLNAGRKEITDKKAIVA
jgi:hypothetical protein